MIYVNNLKLTVINPHALIIKYLKNNWQNRLDKKTEE